MSVHTLLAALAVAALLLALLALGLAVRVTVKTGDARRMAHRHLTVGDRRKRDTGPPPGTTDRRRHADPDESRARRRDVDDPRWRVDEPGHLAAPGDTYPPRPVPQPVPGDDTPTSGLPAVPATRDMRLPPPGAIR